VADGRSVLVNFVYCHPVGHAIEALHYCHGPTTSAGCWRCAAATAT
jgi:hypothetical protein